MLMSTHIVKMQRKKLDLMIVNEIDTKTGYPFNSDNNSISIINKENKNYF